MADETLDREGWQRRWEQVLREHLDKVASRPPNRHLVTELEGVAPGRALDAGSGHGAEAIWLAQAGWVVTAVDFSAAALGQGRHTAESIGDDLARRIDWIEGDLGTWTPRPRAYDLVACLYVHIAGSVPDMILRLGSGVAPGGTLLMVGHQPLDPATGAQTRAAGQVQASVSDVVHTLDQQEWDVLVAEDRPRPEAGGGVDAVVRATFRG